MKLYKQAIFLIPVLICLIVFPASAMAAEYEGFDVSVWQGTIDFEAVRSAGKEVVYMRAGYGLTEDTQFRTNDAANLWDDSLTAYPLWVADHGLSAPYSTGSWAEWAGFLLST